MQMSSRSEPSEPFAAAAETHTAAVYFAGDRAYKLKKPVRTGFLDFTTAGARAAACRRETELNRRFAPDVYLGVGEFRAQAAEPAEPLVIMRRLPSGRRLARLAGGELSSSSTGTQSSPLTPRLPRCAIITWPTGRSFARKSAASAPRSNSRRR